MRAGDFYVDFFLDFFFPRKIREVNEKLRIERFTEIYVFIEVHILINISFLLNSPAKNVKNQCIQL